MIIKKNHIAVLFTIVLWLAVGCSRQDNFPKVIKVGLSHGKSHSFTLALEKFASELEEKTNGKYKVKIYHSSQLGGEKEMQEMLTIGSLEMTVTGLLNTYEPLFSLFEMPFLYRDRHHAYQINNGPIVHDVAKSLNENGISLVGFYENGFRNITNSVKAINNPEDVEGLKIRTPENPAQIETIRALHGIPTPMSFSELYTALLQGVIDGQENPLQNIWYGRFYEAQKYLAVTQHIYNAAYVVVSNRFWDELDEEDQHIFKICMNASIQWQLKYMENLDRELEAKMKDKGVKFTYPDRVLFEKASYPAYQRLYEQLGPKAKLIVEKIKANED
ncbi:TRAP transporter substrate-binding protein [Flexithrix dorotheae]|uniref:TRAP transporter substrate-binding protein n=1 Tax=Flexithrix dorotheae TaxID=70993 RepID=UPI000373C7D1|nr:TRAP transporter substrate-binding protein [Flexithrix dorotheae]